MKVELVAFTGGAHGTEFEGRSIDEIIVGMARVSTSKENNELFADPHKLLRHCLLEQHWSIFDECNLTFKIETNRAMGRELLRHQLKPQEFSQRYSAVTEFEEIELREQSKNNRQSSTELMDDHELDDLVKNHLKNTEILYKHLLSQGVARECARGILPEAAKTTLYLNGTVRVWLSVLNQRLHKTAQKEIRLIAEAIRDEFIKKCPIISKMMFNFEEAYDIHLFERIVLEKYGLFEQTKEVIKAKGKNK